jgi:hypothetical protein
VLDARIVVVGARGAATGIGRLLGARAVVPDGATGQPDSDLAAKARAAVAAIAMGAARVVVHVGGPDEAAHARDVAAKVAVLERADRELLAPLADAVRAAGGTLRVCPDHGCDPTTGAHDDAPVPCLDWPARAPVFGTQPDSSLRAPEEPPSGVHLGGLARARDAATPGAPRLSERAVAALPVVELATREAVAA